MGEEGMGGEERRDGGREVGAAVGGDVAGFMERGTWTVSQRLIVRLHLEGSCRA
jgi:hypothetical protein